MTHSDKRDYDSECDSTLLAQLSSTQCDNLLTNPIEQRVNRGGGIFLIDSASKVHPLPCKVPKTHRRASPPLKNQELPSSPQHSTRHDTSDKQTFFSYRLSFSCTPFPHWFPFLSAARQRPLFKLRCNGRNVRLAGGALSCDVQTLTPRVQLTSETLPCRGRQTPPRFNTRRRSG